MLNKPVFMFLAALVFFTPLYVNAAVFEGGDGTDGGLFALFANLTGSGLIQSDNIIEVIMGWVKFVLALLGTIAFVAFIWAGFLYITAFAGGEENAESAKKTMIWTSVGIIVILISYALVSTLIRATI